jgi:hypothetical protein
MKRMTPFLVVVLYASILNAQIKDSLKTSTKSDSLKILYSIDSLDVKRNIDTLRIDTVKNADLIYIKKSLLDSLLRPFYKIRIDTISNDIFQIK